MPYFTITLTMKITMVPPGNPVAPAGAPVTLVPDCQLV